MKTTLLTLITIIWTLTAICQETKLIIKKFNDSKQISESYSVLKSDGKTKHGEFVSYFKVSEAQFKSIKKGTLKLDNYIMQKVFYKNGKKEGEWLEFSQPSKLKSKGIYKNDKKAGVWETYFENGIVIQKFDYDSGKKLKTVVNLNVEYPTSDYEAGVQGIVRVGYSIHDDCSISDLKIIKGLSANIDKATLDAYAYLGKLMKIYGVDCENKYEEIEVKFKIKE
jgi:hypothetical protein